MLKKLITCTTCLLISTTTFSAKWEIFDLSDHFIIYVDTESLNVDSNSNMVTHWYKAVARKNLFEEKIYKGDFSVAYQVVDCTNKTLATKSNTDYKANGSVKESENFEKLSFEHIIPDSIGEIFLDLCESKPNVGHKTHKIDI